MVEDMFAPPREPANGQPPAPPLPPIAGLGGGYNMRSGGGRGKKILLIAALIILLLAGGAALAYLLTSRTAPEANVNEALNTNTAVTNTVTNATNINRTNLNTNRAANANAANANRANANATNTANVNTANSNVNRASNVNTNTTSNANTNATANANVSANTNQSTTPPSYSSDPDSDKLNDYLEGWLATNKKKEDSDGDSYADAAEVTNGYSPLSTGKLSVPGFKQYCATSIFITQYGLTASDVDKFCGIGGDVLSNIQVMATNSTFFTNLEKQLTDACTAFGKIETADCETVTKLILASYEASGSSS